MIYLLILLELLHGVLGLEAPSAVRCAGFKAILIQCLLAPPNFSPR